MHMYYLVLIVGRAPCSFLHCTLWAHTSLPLPRLLAHDDNWPKLSHWYQRFRALYTINGDQDLGEGESVQEG